MRSYRIRAIRGFYVGSFALYTGSFALYTAALYSGQQPFRRCFPAKRNRKIGVVLFATQRRDQGVDIVRQGLLSRCIGVLLLMLFASAVPVLGDESQDESHALMKSKFFRFKMTGEPSADAWGYHTLQESEDDYYFAIAGGFEYGACTGGRDYASEIMVVLHKTERVWYFAHAASLPRKCDEIRVLVLFIRREVLVSRSIPVSARLIRAGEEKK